MSCKALLLVSTTALVLGFVYLPMEHVLRIVAVCALLVGTIFVITSALYGIECPTSEWRFSWWYKSDDHPGELGEKLLREDGKRISEFVRRGQ